MKNVQLSLAMFNSIKRYFLSDRRALTSIRRYYDIWDRDTLNNKIGVLGLKQWVPDYQYGNFARFDR